MMKISLNIKLDKEVYENFREGSVGGVDFGKKIRDAHPNISLENHNEYIDRFYADHSKELDAVVLETQVCFQEIESPLFTELKKYFGRDFNKNEYTCHLSIFDCNPRYIETKTFQVYYKRPKNLRKEVIAHELTHFAFYDFCFELGLKDDKKLWELSEIFNVIFLNLPSIREVIGAEEKLFYPDLKEKLWKVKQIWNEGLQAKTFIARSLECL